MGKDPRDSSDAAARAQRQREAADRAAEIAKQEAAEAAANPGRARQIKAAGKSAASKETPKIAKRNKDEAIKRAKRQGKS